MLSPATIYTSLTSDVTVVMTRHVCVMMHVMMYLMMHVCGWWFSAHHLSKTMQGTYKTMAGGTDYDQQWITIL